MQQNMGIRGFHVNKSGALASFGFGLTLAWCMLASHTTGFASSSLGVEAFFNPRMFYLLGIFLLAVVYSAAPRACKRADGALRYVMPLLSSFGTACFGLAYHQTFFDPAVLAVGGLFMVGVGFFWFLARYVLLLARTQEFACAVWAVVGALFVRLTILPVFNFLASPEGLVAIAIVLPIVSAVVFEIACRMARRDVRQAGLVEDTLSSGRTVYGVPVKARAAAPASPTFRRNVLILMVVSAILLAVIRSVSNLGLWGSANAGAPLLSLLLVGVVVPVVFLVIFAYFALIRMTDFTVTMRFQPAMLLILAGLFVVALQASPSNAALPFLTDVIQVDELFAHLLFWTVVITALDALDMPSYRVIGISEAVFAAASIAWMLFLGTSEIVNNMYVLLATYVIVIAAMYATWLGGKRRSDEKSEVSSAADDRVLAGQNALVQPQENSPLGKTVADTCVAIAKRYELSPRETEVFILLAQGRTRAFIQDELVLSGSTVRTHVNHIYAKMDVHDRQEMMNLIWN